MLRMAFCQWGSQGDRACEKFSWGFKHFLLVVILRRPARLAGLSYGDVGGIGILPCQDFDLRIEGISVRHGSGAKFPGNFWWIAKDFGMDPEVESGWCYDAVPECCQRWGAADYQGAKQLTQPSRSQYRHNQLISCRTIHTMQ